MNLTRTYRAKTSDRKRRRGGYTFIELMIVMTLLAVIMSFSVPAFQSLLEGTVTKEVNRLTGVVRLVRSEAILTRKTFRLVFDLERHGYAIEEKNPFGKFELKNEPRSIAPHEFDDSIRIRDIMIFGRRLERMDTSQAPVVIDDSGFMDPFLLHLDVDGKPHTLRVAGLKAKMELLDGYVEKYD